MCAIGFGVAFLAETALTARGQEILTVHIQKEGRCVVWGAPVEGAGVTSSRGVALLGGPGVRIAPLDVPDELSAQWHDDRIVAGKARLGALVSLPRLLVSPAMLMSVMRPLVKPCSSGFLGGLRS